METLNLDAPSSAKKSRVMDMPIYLLCLEFDDRRLGSEGPMFRCYVIESDCGSEDTAAGELLGEERYIKKSEEGGDRVREMSLPDVGPDFEIGEADLVAVKSRLFIINISDQIVYFDLKQQQRSDDQKWKTYISFHDELALICHNGAVVADDGDWIYTLLKNDLIRFRCDNNLQQDSIPEVFPNPVGDEMPRVLLGVSESKVFMCAVGDVYNTVQAGFYDLEKRSWTVSVSFRIGCLEWSELPSRTVLVSDSFLILYSEFHPDSYTAGLAYLPEYCPGLYVYDIRRKKWLPDPVQGITDFPSSPRFDRFHISMMMPTLNRFHVSVMQVRRDVLKFAFVWSAQAMPERRLSYSETEVHWSKFMLRIEEDKETPDIPPTLHAEGLSSGVILGGDTWLFFSTAGKDC